MRNFFRLPEFLMYVMNYQNIAQQHFPNTDFSLFGQLIQFQYHHEPNKVLYAVVQKVYASGIQATCLNWNDDEPIFERYFYTDHFVSEIIDCATGEVFTTRAFYEQYMRTYCPERKFGDTLAGNKNSLPQICFTGFAAKRKAELKELAKQTKFWVTDEVRLHLEYLVCGGNAGAKKIEKAKQLGAVIWSEQEFLDWLSSQESKR